MNRLALRPAEVAEAIGIARTRVYELIHSGELPAFRVGNSILVSVDAIKEWMARQEPAAAVALEMYTRVDRA
jgi:excisionase family DNA binding protein